MFRGVSELRSAPRASRARNVALASCRQLANVRSLPVLARGGLVPRSFAPHHLHVGLWLCGGAPPVGCYGALVRSAHLQAAHRMPPYFGPLRFAVSGGFRASGPIPPGCIQYNPAFWACCPFVPSSQRAFQHTGLSRPPRGACRAALPQRTPRPRLMELCHTASSSSLRLFQGHSAHQGAHAHHHGVLWSAQRNLFDCASRAA